MIKQQPYTDIQKALVTTYPLYPIFDVEENDNNYVLCLDGRVILGNEIEIELVNDELIIQGHGDIKSGNGLEKDLVVRSHGQSIGTQYRDGLLFITIPKNNQKLCH